MPDSPRVLPIGLKGFLAGTQTSGAPFVKASGANAASQVRDGAGAIDPERSAASIQNFTDSTLARRMFSPQELGAMRDHAQGVRGLNNLIESLPATQRARQAETTYQSMFGGENIGGGQAAVYRRIMEGTATPQETANSVFGAVNSQSAGNVVRLLRSVEGVVGQDSETMNAIRQGVWQKLTKNAEGKDQPGQQKIFQAVNEFLNGNGRMIAQQLYTPEERALMDQYAKAVKMTVIPKYARTNSDTAPALLAAVHKFSGAVASSLGGLFHGPTGALAGYGASKILQRGADSIKDMKEMNRIRGHFDPPSPGTARPPAPVNPIGGAPAAGSFASSANTGSPNLPALFNQFQGTVPAGAAQERNQQRRGGRNNQPYGDKENQAHGGQFRRGGAVRQPHKGPPIPGARKAPDGHWYVKDHTRGPNKYLRWIG